MSNISTHYDIKNAEENTVGEYVWHRQSIWNMVNASIKDGELIIEICQSWCKIIN